MNDLCKHLDELFESMDLERCAHDEEKIRFLPDVSGLDGPNILAEWMNLVVEYDIRAKDSHLDCTFTAGNTRIGYRPSINKVVHL